MSEIVKQIELDAEEYARANRVFLRVLQQLLDNTIELQLDDEDSFWDEYAKKFGFEGLSEQLSKGFTMRVSWANRKVVLTKMKEQDDA